MANWSPAKKKKVLFPYDKSYVGEDQGFERPKHLEDSWRKIRQNY